MAIRAGDYKVTNDLQQNLKNEVVNDAHSKLDSINENTYLFVGNNPILGITPDMLPRITSAIDNYISNIITELDNSSRALDYSQAYKGTQLPVKIEEFVFEVNELCKRYIEKLQQAEQEIIQSVQAHYEAHDIHLADQLASDTSKLGN